MISRVYLCFTMLMMALSVYAGPKIEHWQTHNGARVYFVTSPELPMLDVQVVFDAGSARDGQYPGLAMMTNAMLNEGAAGLTTDQIASGFENVGARFGNDSQRDMAMLSLRTLTQQDAMETALALFTQVLTQPDFPKTSFARIKRQQLISLQAEKQSPGAVAARAFYQAVYGTHPYAAMPMGAASSVQSLTIEQVKAFYRRYYVAKNAIVVLVGAIDKTQAKAIAEQLVSALPAGEAATPLPAVPELKTARTIPIDFASTQTHILMGQPGMKRGDPDYFALYVGNHILGGSGLVSRLSDEVREKRGLSYSVYSYFRPMRERGPYVFGLQTRNDQTQQALDVMRKTLKQFIKTGPSQAELEAAKQNITGSFPLRLDSNSKIAGYLAMLGFYGLPLDYLDTFNDKIKAVTVSQIKTAFAHRVHTDAMVTVIVGGKKK